MGSRNLKCKVAIGAVLAGVVTTTGLSAGARSAGACVSIGGGGGGTSDPVCVSPPPAPSTAPPTVWGVDTTDNVQQTNDITLTRNDLGSTPYFVGRYIIWGGGSTLSSQEANYILSQGVRIMPISSPPNSYLLGATKGQAEAQAMINQAHNLGIPPYTVLWRDVETNYSVDAAYVGAFHSTFATSTYFGGFYENPDNGAFPTAFCNANAANADIAADVQLWASEPDFAGYDPHASKRPVWQPDYPRCAQANTTVAWQYEIRSLFPAITAPNVDVDEMPVNDTCLLWKSPTMTC